MQPVLSVFGVNLDISESTVDQTGAGEGAVV